MLAVSEYSPWITAKELSRASASQFDPSRKSTATAAGRAADRGPVGRDHRCQFPLEELTNNPEPEASLRARNLGPEACASPDDSPGARTPQAARSSPTPRHPPRAPPRRGRVTHQVPRIRPRATNTSRYDENRHLACGEAPTSSMHSLRAALMTGGGNPACSPRVRQRAFRVTCRVSMAAGLGRHPRWHRSGHPRSRVLV